MSLFTPLRGLIGGGLIGLSASVLLLGAGEIMGASGIASCILHPIKTISTPSHHWKVCFLAAFFIVAKTLATMENTSSTFDPQLTRDPNLPVVSALGHVVAGLLVGFGTKLGNGCTTGHGICGLARFSRRSLVNVISFMSTGIISATICGSGCPLATYLRSSHDSFSKLLPTKTSENVALVALVLVFFMAASVQLRTVKKASAENRQFPKSSSADARAREERLNSGRKFFPAAVSGGLFACGLAISGMCKPSKIYGFLDLSGIHRGTWDPTLLCVMASGMTISMIGYQFVKGYGIFGECTCPLALNPSCGRFEIPTNKKIDLELILGGALFGLGWGIGGLCPGPALWLAAPGFRCILYYWIPAFFLGSFLGEKVKTMRS